MNLPRLLLRLALGRRLPIASGELRVRGPSAPVTIRRDKWGVPHIDAATETDAAFAVGFCHGQDRAGQLEVLWRVGRGRVAEWAGVGGLPADRMSRRIGFRRAAEKQVTALSAEARAAMDAYAHGTAAGATVGLRRKPHEFAILGGQPSPWDAADVLAFLKLQSFLLPSNWDTEIARLHILRADGPDALRAVDPINASDATISPAHAADSRLTEILAADLAAILQLLPRGGGSNNWAVAGSRTASGKPLLASDPHLAPNIPPLWYLAHIRTPDGDACGATMVGAPGFPIGHNGFAAWGVTAGLTDTTDLFLETLGPDGTSVREANGSYSPCERVREVIAVKGQPDMVEEVLITPRGPVVTPLFSSLNSSQPGETPLPAEMVSLRAVWLDPLPVDGFLTAVRARSFEEFRRPFAAWPILPLNIVYADADGTIGYQLAGQIPQRKSGHGLLPMPADAPGAGWEPELVPFDEMPFVVNPPTGFVATANNPPAPPDSLPFLGLDFLDPYRIRAIRDELSKREDWNVVLFGELQTNVRSLPWEEIRALVLSLTPDDPAAREALALLRDWDGQVTADSPAAAVFELFLAELSVRVAKAKAPNSWRVAVGNGGLGTDGHNLFGDRRVGHLVRLLREQPADGFARPWAEEMADVLSGIVQRLRKQTGPGAAYWGWGHLRTLTLEHYLFGKHRLLGPMFNLGPVPCGGDSNTISQAAVRPLTPTASPQNLANLRAVFDLADVSRNTFVLCGGQSGNPCSPHFADQFPLWQAGESIALPWTQEQVIRVTKHTLRLLPAM